MIVFCTMTMYHHQYCATFLSEIKVDSPALCGYTESFRKIMHNISRVIKIAFNVIFVIAMAATQIEHQMDFGGG